MSLFSVLGQEPEATISQKSAEVPSCFADLYLDQILDAVTSGKEEYDLKAFFYVPLHDVDAISYRHEILWDLENPSLLALIKCFADTMRTMRRCHAQAERLRNEYQKQRWFLDGIESYCAAVTALTRDLDRIQPRSRGLRAFREYLVKYCDSHAFAALIQDSAQVKRLLSEVKYSMLVWDSGITVRRATDETDYASEIERTFEKFKQGAASDYTIKFQDFPEMNGVEEKIIEFVARLYSDTFKALASYCELHRDFLDDTIRSFDREIQFYVAYLDYTSVFKAKGFAFCYPTMSLEKQIFCNECFDLALAQRLNAKKEPVVTNDFYLTNNERILVVSGPNQGGKTTFARTFGQVHYLASLGLPVPGTGAKLLLFDDLFTHFEREENISTLRGALEESLSRIHDILERTTSRGIIITNELFASTTVKDALYLGRRILEEVMKLDAVCVCVTFLDELASLSEKTVSMVSTVVPGNPALRTFKILRRPADGLAWAISIAQKYGLTYERIKERIRE